MSKWLIWRWGTKEPSPALLTDMGLDEYDHRNALRPPIKLKPEEENLPFVSLIQLYPPPEKTEKTEFSDKPVTPKKRSAD